MAAPATSGDDRVAPIDVSSMPRLGRAPVVQTPEQAAATGLDRHPSMEDVGRRTLMWAPDLLDAYIHLSTHLRSSTRLPERDREIAILRHAWDCGADYQWGMHTDMALEAGLTGEEVARLAQDSAAGDWPDHEQAVIQAVDELHVANRVGDRTWAELAAHYDEAQIVELLVLVGSYRMLAYVQTSVGIRPPAGVSPDLPGNTFLFTSHTPGQSRS